MKIGVELKDEHHDPGETFADARALEAAGVDALWASENAHSDHTLLLAAIAAVTSRVRIVWVKGSKTGAIESLDRLSRGRLAADSGVTSTNSFHIFATSTMQISRGDTRLR